MMNVCLPGTGGIVPLPGRWLACCWAEYQGQAVLIDCGEGTQIALKQAGCRLSQLDVLLITHFHADHIAGLPGLLLTMGNGGRAKPLTIIGPPGLTEIVSALTVIAPCLPFYLNLIEMNDPDKEFIQGVFHITCLPLAHPIPCFGYKLQIKRKPVFNPDKAMQLNVPLKYYKTLHEGQPVTLENGRIIGSYEVLDGERKPLSLCYCTDTLPLYSIAEFALGADLLIAEGMYADEAMRGRMEQKQHMLFSDSANLAVNARVGKLLLTHFSPALMNPENEVHIARKIFPDTSAAHDGIWIDL